MWRRFAAAFACAALAGPALAQNREPYKPDDDLILARSRRGDPHCKPHERHQEVLKEERIALLQPLGTMTDRVRINCIVIDVRRHLNSSEAVCGSRDKLPYRLYVIAEMPDRHHEWHVDNIIGGSIDEIVYSTDGPANYTLKFYNDHPDDCDYHVTWAVDYCVDGKDGCPVVRAVDVQNTLPTLTAVTPTSIYLRTPVTFAFQQARTAHQHDRAKAIHRDAFPPGTVDPCEYEGEHAYHMERGKEEDSTEVLERGLQAYFTHTFNRVGLYFLCYGPHQEDGDIDFQEVATVTVFGGNPDYFVMYYKPPSAPSQPPVYVFIFYGEGLDLRPHVAANANHTGQGDRAKVVYQSGDCADELQPGVPGAGGVLMGTDLGPDDSASSHLAEYYIVFQTGGRFRICYQRFGHEWIEVPNLEDLPDGFFSHRKPGSGTPAPRPPATPIPAVAPGVAPGLPPAPRPPVRTPAPPLAACAPHDITVPPRAKLPSFPTVLQLTVAGGHLPRGFHDGISSVLGVPGEVVRLTDAERAEDSDGNAVLRVDVDLQCSMYVSDTGLPGCSTREKKDLLIYLIVKHDACIRALNITGVAEKQAAGTLVCVQGSTDGRCRSVGTPVAPPPAPSSHGSTLATVGVVCLTVVAVAGIAVGAVWLWRRNEYASPSEVFASVAKGVSPWGNAEREMI
eukprot:TRINITY_DN5819_c0_g1_i1.p1 TRINITY_DN5819_c0_g1~~TRINITY_DN5819_c0_g1_i1.p1  ORF type:complete len:719 (+),score=207.91 TRINITY_DN5819_c0_g1_i1:128-2158(+)